MRSVVPGNEAQLVELTFVPSTSRVTAGKLVGHIQRHRAEKRDLEFYMDILVKYDLLVPFPLSHVGVRALTGLACCSVLVCRLLTEGGWGREAPEPSAGPQRSKKHASVGQATSSSVPSRGLMVFCAPLLLVSVLMRQHPHSFALPTEHGEVSRSRA